MEEAPTSSSTTENAMNVSEESMSPNTSSSTENSKINTQSSYIVIGSSDFKKVIESAAFVDKTLLIKDFVKSGDKVVLITVSSF